MSKQLFTDFPKDALAQISPLMLSFTVKGNLTLLGSGRFSLLLLFFLFGWFHIYNYIYIILIYIYIYIILIYIYIYIIYISILVIFGFSASPRTTQPREQTNPRFPRWVRVHFQGETPAFAAPSGRSFVGRHGGAELGLEPKASARGRGPRRGKSRGFRSMAGLLWGNGFYIFAYCGSVVEGCGGETFESCLLVVV